MCSCKSESAVKLLNIYSVNVVLEVAFSFSLYMILLQNCCVHDIRLS